VDDDARDSRVMTFEMAASRIVPTEVETTFGRVLPMPLEDLFTRWRGPIPPIRSTSGPDAWQTPGQRRTVNLVGPGWMTETLTLVDPPHSFSYRLDDIHGPMRALVAEVHGRWSFAPVAGGTTITWSWDVTARPRTRWLLPTFARFWRGYADQALGRIEEALRDLR
jgi:hypothetical protein